MATCDMTLFPPKNKLTFATPPPQKKTLCKFCTGFLFYLFLVAALFRKLETEIHTGQDPQNAHQRKNDPAPKFFFNRKASKFCILLGPFCPHSCAHTSLATNKDGASQQRQRERERERVRGEKSEGERERERARS